MRNMQILILRAGNLKTRLRVKANCMGLCRKFNAFFAALLAKNDSFLKYCAANAYAALSFKDRHSADFIADNTRAANRLILRVQGQNVRCSCV